MLFSSPIFAWLFLPVVLALYFGLKPGLRNLLLLLASLCFYAWGEKLMVAIMMISIGANYGFGLWVDRAREKGSGKTPLVCAVLFNVGLLVTFKYADWLWSIASYLLVSAHIIDTPFAELGSFLAPDSAWRGILLTPQGRIHLPIGVSFFTFQATSYVIDIYRGDVRAEPSLVGFAMYKSFFGQLIAGPIVRYRDVHDQIHERTVTQAGFALGVRRFVIGLGKKMLVANVVAQAADHIFGVTGKIVGVPAAELTPQVAWLGILCYTLQIYFDFSGYSDMAIGLGHMFGFTFLENFDHPYVAKSITHFWRRWHISLSTWFRDYLYIPLGGSRVRLSRTYLNLIVVFFLCGLWHGASFNFVVWGLYHGSFLVLERIGILRWLEPERAFARGCERLGSPALARGIPAFLQHVYVLLVVMIGWVFFRAGDLSTALHYLATMLGLQDGLPLVHHVDLWLDSLLATAILAGVIGSTAWLPRALAWYARIDDEKRGGLKLGLEIGALLALALMFLSSAFELAAGSYNPFIYFRF